MFKIDLTWYTWAMCTQFLADLFIKAGSTVPTPQRHRLLRWRLRRWIWRATGAALGPRRRHFLNPHQPQLPGDHNEGWKQHAVSVGWDVGYSQAQLGAPVVCCSKAGAKNKRQRFGTWHFDVRGSQPKPSWLPLLLGGYFFHTVTRL